ncbi:hypothetical protein [Pontibacter litorisediminis]|uniref:hypothetical protein n=1 Tax=Pontibacter litorisediminis TaxID=1846260 RepID=UPI0023EC756A|nr:hypothetical protein [Pontibacter litorisediminis]
MIVTEKLSRADKRKIKRELKQVLVSYAASGVIVAIVLAAASIFIITHASFPFGKDTAITALHLATVTSFAGLLFQATKKYLRDVRSGTKRTSSGIITDKYTQNNWGWHGNPAADAGSRPRLVEFFLVINNQRIQVEEEAYSTHEIGEQVKLYFSLRSNILLGITTALDHPSKAQASPKA